MFPVFLLKVMYIKRPFQSELDHRDALSHFPNGAVRAKTTDKHTGGLYLFLFSLPSILVAI